MRKGLLAFTMFLLCSASAFAWNCPTGQIRQQAPAGTPTTAPYYDVVEGIAFICVPSEPTPSTTGSSSTSTSSSNATGGNASSTATGGNANQKQGQKQSQTQSNSSTNNNQSAGGSVSDVGNSETTVEAPKIPVNTAMAPPVFSSVNCFKGWSAGGQTPLIGGSFGGGGIDKNCAALVTAQALYAVGSREGACRVIVNTKSAKDAGVTLATCMAAQPPRPVVAVPTPAPVPPQPISVTVNVPESKLVYLTPAPTPVKPVVPLGNAKPATKKHVSKPCIVPPSLLEK
jgi:hypothetical protein